MADINGQIILGLSQKEVSIRLKTYGYNELPSMQQSPLVVFIFKLFREPMFLLLVACASIYMVLGDNVQGMMLFGFVLVMMGITSFQEYRSERAIIALRKLACPRALVIREGKGIRIAGREVVPGDIISLHEGDTVPADAKLLFASNFLVDESILSGESHSVRKVGIEESNIKTLTRPGGDALPYVYSGTQVTQGNGYAEVYATGAKTEFGEIGKNLKLIKVERTRLQQETSKFVRIFAILGLSICLLVVMVYSITRGNWIGGLLSGLTLAMAILPEELPVVITVFLAQGARRIARRNVLTREIPAIEALGSATVLCVDKTGTITQNRLTVGQLFAIGERINIAGQSPIDQLPENFHQLMEYAILASQKDPFDPMDIAIKNFGETYLKNTEHWHESWKLVHQYPLSKKLLTISQVWRSKKNKHYMIAAKGAPEDIFDLCHLDNNKINKLREEVDLMANYGLRIIGVAQAVFTEENLPLGQHDFEFEFLGLIGLEDPIRPKIVESVATCHEAGIKVIMITGDYSTTAKRVATAIGLKNDQSIITGQELFNLSDRELEEKIKNTNIFARVLPEQKLRIVNALKANGEIVAMTGDGINDAPALKAANIGVAMGKRGTDVARESAGLVLLDDDFSSLVAAIKLGRRIYTNIKKAFVYLLAVHIPIIGVTLIPVLFKWPLVLFPIHIVFLQLIIGPTCSLVFEAAGDEPDSMQKPPRKKDDKLFERKTFIQGCYQGIGVLILSIALLLILKSLGWNEGDIRAAIFACLVLSNLVLIFINLSPRIAYFNSSILTNWTLWGVVGLTLAFLTLALTLPFLRQVFMFGI